MKEQQYKDFKPNQKTMMQIYFVEQE